MKVVVGVSNRHVHLTKEVYDKLFDKPLTKLRDLDQPGQFAANECVSIRIDDEVIDNVRIVGPLRDYCQVEISRTDAYKLNVDPPIRMSGDLLGSLPVTLVGLKGEVFLEEGLIIASRHIHIKKSDLVKYGFSDNEVLAIKVCGEKGGILKNVHLKAGDNSSFKLHLDTDEANAFGLKTGDAVEVVRIKE
ncbi:MAG: phosphate propanoyltransferase [Bacilli bacterium]|nr:phosphate propanoyltransferase [Bacilli bacterium]